MFNAVRMVVLAAGLLAAGGTAMAADSDNAPVVVEVSARPILYVASRVKASEMAAASQAIGVAYGKIGKVMKDIGAEQDGAPLAINLAFDPKADWVFQAAIPVKGAPSMPFEDAEVKSGATPSGRVVKAVHVGPYSTMHETYDAITAFMTANNMKPGALSWEEYVSDPGNTPEAQLITNVYYQIAP